MSLLLDALKKAAKDKEAASAKPAGDTQVAADIQALVADEVETPFEFELDDALSADNVENKVSASETELTLGNSAAVEKLKPIPNTVSDEALQVLIYKTNSEYRRRRRIIWVSGMLVSVVVLVASGLYFFNKMQQEVESLERRHRLNMQAVESEPVKTTRDKSAEIQSQVESFIKPKSVSKETQKERVMAPQQRAASGEARAVAHGNSSSNKSISIERGEKRDPISALLNKAWAAYNNMEYSEASVLYERVLEREKNNRDALMGMAALALKNGKSDTARQYYNRLLQLDPRDAIANAAIINMNVSDANGLSESKLQTLIRQNPQAAHLHFALGNRYAAQNQWQEAQAAYFKALENDSNNADYAYNLAVSLERIGKPKEALQFYQAAIANSRDSNISFSIDVVNKRIGQLAP